MTPTPHAKDFDLMSQGNVVLQFGTEPWVVAPHRKWRRGGSTASIRAAYNEAELALCVPLMKALKGEHDAKQRSVLDQAVSSRRGRPADHAAGKYKGPF